MVLRFTQFKFMEEQMSGTTHRTMEQQIAVYRNLGNTLKTSRFYRANKCVVDQMMSTIMTFQNGDLISDADGILVFPMLPISLLNHGNIFQHYFYVEEDVKSKLLNSDSSPYIMHINKGGEIGKPIDLAMAIQFGAIPGFSNRLYVDKDIFFTLSPEKKWTKSNWRIHSDTPSGTFEKFMMKVTPL